MSRKEQPELQSSHIERKLEQKILSGEWEKGDRLPSEGRLCDEFGVSRTMLREALRALRGRGLVETISGSGSYVAGVKIETVTRAMETFSQMAGVTGADEEITRDLVDFRLIIECEAAARLAVNSENKEALTVLQKTIDDMSNVTQAAEVSRLDLEFHLCLLNTSGNKFISMMAKAMYMHYQKFIIKSHEAGLDDIREITMVEHQKIVDEIRLGSAAKARDAVHTHLSDAAERWRNL